MPKRKKMFKKVLLASKAPLKICTAIVCGAVMYNNLTSAGGLETSTAAAGYNYSRRYYPAAAEYPDVAKNRNIMARNLTKHMYARLRDLRTPNGFTIDDAIQTGKNDR